MATPPSKVATSTLELQSLGRARLGEERLPAHPHPSPSVTVSAEETLSCAAPTAVQAPAAEQEIAFSQGSL